MSSIKFVFRFVSISFFRTKEIVRSVILAACNTINLLLKTKMHHSRAICTLYQGMCSPRLSSERSPR
ncbi:hypothetical protein T11_2733 [Trichinella zimbabwensis]|uniref:Uncharacterized protein n=1 Tax=Trichinella zimbabwensis TaxID=268475 RepID=A0A0V1GN03_9BILA|nr:hypothetical protein T11_2733 [Trichinella zimbabwensis]